MISRRSIAFAVAATLFGGPAFATDASRPADPTKRSNSPHSTRTKTNERQDLSDKASLSGKYR